MAWERGERVIELPDGARLRGSGLRAETPDAAAPEWVLLLLGEPPLDVGGFDRWVRWPDFRLPADRRDAGEAFHQAHALALDGVRVQVMCTGGLGRTGTALACIAQIGGVSPRDAVTWTRRAYDPRAIETPWQRLYVRHLWRRPGRPAPVLRSRSGA